MFNALRLSVEVLAEVLADITVNVTADVIADVANRTELKVQVEIRQPKELKVFNSLRLSIVLLLAIRY